MHALLGTGFFSSCSTVAVTSSVLFLELSEFRFFAAAGLSFLPSFLPPTSLSSLRTPEGVRARDGGGGRWRRRRRRRRLQPPPLLGFLSNSKNFLAGLQFKFGRKKLGVLGPISRAIRWSDNCKMKGRLHIFYMELLINNVQIIFLLWVLLHFWAHISQLCFQRPCGLVKVIRYLGVIPVPCSLLALPCLARYPSMQANGAAALSAVHNRVHTECFIIRTVSNMSSFLVAKGWWW